MIENAKKRIDKATTVPHPLGIPFELWNQHTAVLSGVAKTNNIAEG